MGWLAACQPTKGEEQSPDVAFSAYALINAPNGFYFMPPLAPPPSYSGTFDATRLADLSVYLEHTDASGAYSITDGVFDRNTNPNLFLKAEHERYMLLLTARNYFTDRSASYRFRVFFRGAPLASADMPGEIFQFIDRYPTLQLNMSFRLETQAIDRDGDGVLDVDDHCPDLYDPSNPVPTPEVCDGIDNDCNGLVDDHPTDNGTPCSTGLLGACATGARTCTASGPVCSQTVFPTAESCNGIDDDCDGTVDEGTCCDGFISSFLAATTDAARTMIAANAEAAGCRAPLEAAIAAAGLNTQTSLVLERVTTTRVACSAPDVIQGVGNTAFFTINDGTNPAPNRELWMVNDSMSAATKVGEIEPSGSSDPQSFAAVGNSLYFSATRSDTGREPWRYNLSTGTLSLVRDIRPGTASGYTTFETPSFVGDNTRAYFKANDGTNGMELYTTDGTPAGTTMLDIRPGSGNADPGSLTMYHGQVVMYANDGVHGLEPWISDGTQAGTRMISDIYSGTNGSILTTQFFELNGYLLFSAGDAVSGVELWRTDGTLAGTSLVRDIAIYPSASQASSPYQFGLFHNALYFSAASGNAQTGCPTCVAPSTELWTSDGVPEAPPTTCPVGSPFAAPWGCGHTHMVRDINTQMINPNTNSSSNPQYLTAAPDRFYFLAAPTGASTPQLFSSDGTQAGTVQISNIPFNSGNFSTTIPAPPLAYFGGYAWFIEAGYFTSSRRIWRSDGTTAGTVPYADATGITESGTFAIAGSSLYFAGVSPTTHCGEVHRVRQVTTPRCWFSSCP